MSRATSTEIDQFLAELNSMTRAGLPLPEGLKIHADHLPPGALRELSNHIASAMAAGKPLSEALTDSPVATSRALIAVARCAEISGNPEEVFSFALRHSKQIERHRDSLFTAMLYPALVLIAAPLLMLTFAVYVTPQFEDIFMQLGAELPSTTQVILGFSHFQRSPLGMIITLGFAGAIACCLIGPVAKDSILRSLLNSFFFRRIAELSDAAMTLQFAGALIQRGAPPSEAFAAAEFAAAQQTTSTALRNMSEAATRGQPVSGLLDPTIPPSAAAIIRTGEARGKLGEACSVAAEYCMERFERTGTQLIRVFEPTVIVVLGFGIGIYVIALYLPLFNIPHLVGR